MKTPSLQEPAGSPPRHPAAQPAPRQVDDERAPQPRADQAAIDASPRQAAQRAALQRVGLAPAPQALPAGAPGPVVQRLVASIPGGNWSDKNGPLDDKTFLNTTLTAHARVGGKVKRIDFVDFGADFQDPKAENLAITGHGSPGKIGDKTADDIANYLTSKTTGLKPSHRVPGTIYLESCFAAASDAPSPSLISTLRGKLDTHLGGKDVPTIIGSGGPQITTNLQPHDAQVKEIVKTVVNRNKQSPEYALAGCVQRCLYDKYFDGGQKVNTLLDNSDEGAKFLNQAKLDEVKMSNLKWIFINVVRGTPLSTAEYDKIQPGLQNVLAGYWQTQGYQKKTGVTGTAVFATGVDLRDPVEQETLITAPSGGRISEDYVKDLIARNDYGALEFIFRSNDFPLSKWDGEAWSLMLDWLVSQ